MNSMSMHKTGDSISSFYKKINKLQQSSLYKKLLQYPTCWVETTDKEEINLAYELETYGLVNIDTATTTNNKNSIRIKITHTH